MADDAGHENRVELTSLRCLFPPPDMLDVWAIGRVNASAMFS